MLVYKTTKDLRIIKTDDPTIKNCLVEGLEKRIETRKKCLKYAREENDTKLIKELENEMKKYEQYIKILKKN